MLKFYSSIGCLFIVTASLLGFSQQAVADHEIIGAPKCKACHKAKTGDQWYIWTESRHATAFEVLASDEARKIAADLGLGDPRQEDSCLKCHTTRASLGAGVAISEQGAYTDEEGVGCEACHGPGSAYKAKKVMEDPEAARAAGLIMDATAEACIQCHNDESPTFKGFEFSDSWAQIAHPIPGSEISAPAPATANPEMPGDIVFNSSVGDVVFPHGLHVQDADMECVECHHQIHAKDLDTPHPGYMASSWINCQICHDTNSKMSKKYYKCSDCHHSDLDDIADETRSSKVVIHKNCWSCHQTGTGVDASKGCVECHVKAGK